MLQFREPNPNLLYLVATFSVEPAVETVDLRGSLGRIRRDGDLDWHVQVVQACRRPDQYSSGAALAVVYLRSDDSESPNLVKERDIQKAFDLLEKLIAPKEWASERPLRLNLLEALNVGGDGRVHGGNVYANVVWGAGRGALGLDALDWALLEQHPELGLAIRYFTRGISAADERFLPDACINYARSLECLVGSAQQKSQLRSECDRLGLDSRRALDFLDKTRGRYAIAHALHVVRGERRKLKEPPPLTIEQEGRALARQAIERYIDVLPPTDHDAELRKGIRYTGLPPVGTNLPLPLEVLWATMGAWEQGAPGMAPDWLPLTTASQHHRLSSKKLRSLVQRKLVRGFKRGSRWHVSSVSLEFYKALAAETAMAYRDSTYVPMLRAAEASKISPATLRSLVRNKQLRGRLSGVLVRDAVEENSLRYHVWRGRRRAAVKKLGQLFPA